MFLFCHFPRFISVCFLIVIILRGNLNLCLQIRAFKTTDIPQSIQFSSVQSLSRVRLFATPWIAAQQPSLSITNSRSSLRLMFIESVIIMAYFTNLKCRFFRFFFFLISVLNTVTLVFFSNHVFFQKNICNYLFFNWHSP